jgi:hypothetical protein
LLEFGKWVLHEMEIAAKKRNFQEAEGGLSKPAVPEAQVYFFNPGVLVPVRGRFSPHPHGCL